MITESSHQITVGKLVVNIVRKDIKNLHLGVYPPDGRLRVAAPLKVTDDAVRLMIISKLAWIKKQVAQFEGQQRQSKRQYVSGESHYLNGQRYLLNVIYQTTAPKVAIRNKTHIDLYVREGSSEEKRREIMTEWYRQHLKEQIPALIDKWQSIIGVDVRDWGVKQMITLPPFPTRVALRDGAIRCPPCWPSPPRRCYCYAACRIIRPSGIGPRR